MIAETTSQAYGCAAFSLADKLKVYKGDRNAVLAAVPNGGAPIGYQLSNLLEIPMQFVLCKKISHPADRRKTIGSVSIDEIHMNENSRKIPQDYIYHKTIQLQRILRERCRYYRNPLSLIELKNKVVIVVDDFLKTGNTLLACLMSMRKQMPEKIIVAVIKATREGKREVEQYADEVHVVNVVSDQFSWEDFYREFPRIDDQQVRQLRQNRPSRDYNKRQHDEVFFEREYADN